MRARLILGVVVAASLGHAPVFGQTSGATLAERLGYFTTSQRRGEDQPETAVRTAAAESSSPRSPREVKQNSGRSTAGNSGRGFGGFSLRRLLQSEPRESGTNDEQNHPMPYDAKSSRPQTQESANRWQQNAQQPQQQRSQPTPVASTPRQSPTQSRVASSPERTSAASPGKPRTSPKTSIARSQRELDEALASLQNEGSSSAKSAAGDEEVVPDYLKDLDETLAPRTAAQGPAGRKGAASTPSNSPDSVADFGAALSKSRTAAAKSAPTSAEPSPAAADVLGAFPDPAAGETRSAAIGRTPTGTAPAASPIPELADEPTPAPAKAPLTAAKSPSGSGSAKVLFTSRQPVITSRVEGPRQLVVGRPATYRITLENIGDVAAHEVLALVTVPDSAELIDATATAGAIEQAPAVTGSQAVHWQMPELAAGETKTMDLQLTPRSGADMALGVRFSHAPIGSDAVVKVQEPMLAMTLSGPSEVQFGSPQRFKLAISNPGTGSAENVELDLLPPGGDESAKIHHIVGSLAPGETREIELELTARNSGDLVMEAGAVASGGLTASASKKVRCVKPELEIDWRGPEEKYSGSVATYFLRVRNPGEAATDAVTVDLALPEGAKLVSATNGYTTSDDDRMLAWHGTPLAPGEERFIQVQLALNKPGPNQINLRALTAAGLRDVKAASTNVIAVADLKLEVADPKGPVPVGEPVVYEIRVRNRGSIAARGVNVTGLFSAGIDPVAVDGGRHTVRDGRVAFQQIESLPAGEEIVLKIQAKAHDQGTHVFRAEVVCQDLEVKLSAEEMTRFIQEENPWDSAATAYGSEPSTRR